MLVCLDFALLVILLSVNEEGVDSGCCLTSTVTDFKPNTPSSLTWSVIAAYTPHLGYVIAFGKAVATRYWQAKRQALSTRKVSGPSTVFHLEQHRIYLSYHDLNDDNMASNPDSRPLPDGWIQQ